MKVILLIACFFSLSACGMKTSSSTKNAPKNYIESSKTSNSKKWKNSPYLLLISIDGYRWDYNQIHKPKFLTDFAAKSARLQSLIPSFPTKTFPNHLSIITGRYPMNHGIVANSFYAPDLERFYSLGDRDAVKDPRFYKAKPLWVLAEEQSMKTATFFWPGSEVKIAKHYPSYYLNYDQSTPHSVKTNTVFEWFKMPLEKRPHFVTLYFHDVDEAGHHFGPGSQETKKAIDKVDRTIEGLVSRLETLNLDINVIIVSDHGMAQLSPDKQEALVKNKKSENRVSKYKVIGKGPVVHLYSKESLSNKIIKKDIKHINKTALNYQCHSNKNTEEKLNFHSSSRIGNIVCIANGGWGIFYKKKYLSPGGHGWSQYQGMDMHGIFYAKGPNFRESYTHPSVENIHIFPLLTEILGLNLNVEIDGELESIQALIK